MSVKIRIGEVRFSYAHLFEPQAMDGAEPKYSVSLIIPKSNTKLVEEVKKALKAAYDEAVTTKWGGKAPKNFKNPLKDGDEMEDEHYEGAYILKCSSKHKPDVVIAQMVGGKKSFVNCTDPDKVYSGCYGWVSVALFGYDVSGSKGISAALNNVVKTKDGEPFSGRTSSAEEFKDLLDNCQLDGAVSADDDNDIF